MLSLAAWNLTQLVTILELFDMLDAGLQLVDLVGNSTARIERLEEASGVAEELLEAATTPTFAEATDELVDAILLSSVS